MALALSYPQIKNKDTKLKTFELTLYVVDKQIRFNLKVWLDFFI